MTQNKLKVYVHGQSSYFNAFDKDRFIRTTSMEGADLVCLTGGVDVDPALYGEERHPQTNFPDFERDRSDTLVYDNAIKAKIPVVGICRGSQFLCVMNGGKLIQHVNNHAIHGTHAMLHGSFNHGPVGERIQVTSTHHQMAYPWCIPEEEYRIHGVALPEDDSKLALSTKLEGIPNIPDEVHGDYPDPEVIHYPVSNTLGVQGHPEYVTPDHEFHKYFNNAVLHYLFKEEV